MNILVICDHGQVRSVAMAHVLSEKGHNAIAVSEKTWLEDEQDNLNKWAHITIDMTEIAGFSKSGYYSLKFVNGWIGRDEFGSIYHEQLIALCRAKAEELGF